MPRTDTAASRYVASRGTARSAAFLVEILVVMIILGLMAATAAVSMTGLMHRAARTARPTDPRSALLCADAIDPRPVTGDGVAADKAPDCPERPAP